jgi:hypothetical protein
MISTNSLMPKEQLTLILHRELETLSHNTDTPLMLLIFLEKVILPLLRLFPEVSLGVHYLGKALGITKHAIDILISVQMKSNDKIILG